MCTLAYIGCIWAVYRVCGSELAQGHRVSRPGGTGSVGDSVGEGTHPHSCLSALLTHTHLFCRVLSLSLSLSLSCARSTCCRSPSCLVRKCSSLTQEGEKHRDGRQYTHTACLTLAAASRGDIALLTSDDVGSRAPRDRNLERDGGGGSNACGEGGAGAEGGGRGQEEKGAGRIGEGEGSVARRGETEGVPDEFVCPISMELMVEPVLAAGSWEQKEKGRVGGWVGRC